MSSLNKRRRIHLSLAEAADAWRIVPRLLLIAYGYMVWTVVQWFMQLPDPSTQHAALVSTIVGAAAAVIGIYTGTGRKWETYKFERWTDE